MRTSDASIDTPITGVRVLVADDDPGVRTLFASLLRATAGVTRVIETDDGAKAVEVALERRLDVAVLDLNMPRLDGVEAALRLRALQPTLAIALHSSDPELLRQRAAGLELPLFDKLDLDRLLAWVERRAQETSKEGGRAPDAQMAPKLDLRCGTCGYGIISRLPLPRCPMCGGNAGWVEPSGGRRIVLPLVSGWRG